MKKDLKRFYSFFLAVVMGISAMMFTVSPIQADENEDNAYLSFAAADWGTQYWFDGNDYAPVVATNAHVTDYGQYTVALDFTGVEGGFAKGITFFDVEIAGGEQLFPDSFMTIDSLKINGDEVAMGKSYTSSDDGVATRTNLFNGWVSEVTGGRTADGDATDVTASHIVAEDYPEVKTIEVTFTLGEGVAFGNDNEPKPLPDEGTVAYISMADNSWSIQHWFDGNDYAPVVATNATVTGYGQYTTALDFTGVEGGVCPDIVFMDVEVKKGEIYFPNSYMQIDSVVINGEVIELGNTYTSSDNKLDTRTNLYNQWVASVDEGRTNGLELTEVTAMPLDGTQYGDIETVEVTFTLIEGEAQEVVEEVYEMPTEFNAFLMFSDPSGAWEMYAPGTPGDTTVIGDGKYEVYLKAEDIGATGQATEGQVFVVDIEGLGEAMIHLGTLSEADDETFTKTEAEVTVDIYVDGEKVTAKNKNIIKGDIEENGRFRIELYNKWGTGTQDNPVVMPNFLTPEDEIKVVFTLVGTGLNSDAIIEVEVAEDPIETVAVEPTEDAADLEVPDKDGLPAAVTIPIILIAVIVIGGGIFLAKNKKK